MAYDLVLPYSQQSDWATRLAALNHQTQPMQPPMQPHMPSMDASAHVPSGTLLGLNQNQIGMLGGLGQALASFGGVYSALKGIKQAQRAFDFNKGIVNTNLENSIVDHNRRLNDIATSRAAYYGKSGNDAQGYINDYTGRWEARDNRKDNR